MVKPQSKNSQSKPLVAIVGRPNVGKSTLFNRLVGRRQAIVHETSGITRDRIEGNVEWDGYEFTIADLAGWEEKLDSPFETEVKEIIDDTIDHADLIILMVDGKSGLIPQDEILAEKVRRIGKPVILVINKIDNPQMESYQGDFHKLGFKKVFLISAYHSRAVNDMLDDIISLLKFPDKSDSVETDESIKLALIGRQNVGKSSLFNYLLGDKRSIVSPIPGTTRDSIDAHFEYKDRKFTIVDTAGLRKPTRIKDSIEYYSTVRAKRSLERADIAIFLLDVEDGISDTDCKVGGVIQESHKACLIAANKWDLTKDTEEHRKAFTHHLRKELHFLSYAPVVFTSALQGTGIENLMDAVLLVHHNYNLRIQTADFNRIIREAYQHRPPQSYKGRAPKIFYAHQVDIAPPTFQVFVNDPQLFHNNYKRYIEKKIRMVFGFDGAPLNIYYKRRGKSKAKTGEETKTVKERDVDEIADTLPIDNDEFSDDFDNDDDFLS